MHARRNLIVAAIAIPALSLLLLKAKVTEGQEAQGRATPPNAHAEHPPQPTTGTANLSRLFCVNAYPAKVQASIEAKNKAMRHAAHGVTGSVPFSVIQLFKTWTHKPVTVSFKGGDKELHKQVAAAMSDWTNYGNIQLDFGKNDTTGEYRTWSASDTTYKSDIRVSFDHPEGGYWSNVGMDSIDPTIAGPGEASLNLQDFSGTLSDDDKGTALHEMGHALGFEHEHQSPAGGCDGEFRWEDDASGTPGIYTVLGGSPNFWPRSKVDFNLRQLKDSRKLLVTPYDNVSIMHYSFPAWMFVRGNASPCHTDRNNVLSTGDKAGILEAYPHAAQAVAAQAAARRAGLQQAIAHPGVDKALSTRLQHQLDSIK